MRRVWPVLVLTALLLSAAAPAANAQCAMCRASAETLDEQKQQALDMAILILLVPTTSIFGGVLFWALRNRNQTREALDPSGLGRSNENGAPRARREESPAQIFLE